MTRHEIPAEWRTIQLGDSVDVLDSMRVPVNNKERHARIENKSDPELFPYYGATGEVGKIDGFIFDEELVALGEDGVPFLDPKKPKAYMLRGKTWVNNHAHVLRAAEGVSTNQFLLHFLNQFDYQDFVNGGTRLKLTQANMRRMPFTLAPLAEQKVIADKLDTLLAQVENTKARLERIPQILKRFRQSALAAAVNGKLTEEWRGDGNYDSEGYPIAWERKKLSEVGELARGKSKHRPRNDPRLFGSEYPFIQTGEVANSQGEITSATKYYSEFGLAQSRLFPSGTLCITIAANIADTAILKIDACFPDSVVGFTPKESAVCSLYVKYLIDANKHDLESFAPATAQKNINLKILNQLQLPFPPIEEQSEIIHRAERLFTYADTIEKQVNNALARVENLTQSILTKAFRGELTEQWRKDNSHLISGDSSAQALLERIQAERAAAKPAMKNRKKKL